MRALEAEQLLACLDDHDRSEAQRRPYVLLLEAMKQKEKVNA